MTIHTDRNAFEPHLLRAKGECREGTGMEPGRRARRNPLGQWQPKQVSLLGRYQPKARGALRRPRLSENQRGWAVLNSYSSGHPEGRDDQPRPNSWERTFLKGFFWALYQHVTWPGQGQPEPAARERGRPQFKSAHLLGCRSSPVLGCRFHAAQEQTTQKTPENPLRPLDHRTLPRISGL
jgi:hypothetical protein